MDRSKNPQNPLTPLEALPNLSPGHLQRLRAKGILCCEQVYAVIRQASRAGAALPFELTQEELTALQELLERVLPTSTRQELDQAGAMDWTKLHPLGVLDPGPRASSKTHDQQGDLEP